MIHTNNIPPSIADKIGRDLYREANHPLQIVKDKVFAYFKGFAKIEIDNPYVKIENNFDNLLVPEDHPSRQPTDSFYANENEMLRTHMTCYLYPLGKSETGHSKLKYVTCGDVYRKDAIDSTHFPVFHQMDGFSMVEEGVDVKQDLRNHIIGLVKHLFGENCNYRLLEEVDHPEIYFPFTVDSVEIEVELKLDDGTSKFIEVLGAGTVHPNIMTNLGLSGQKAWAFGLGLERLAMVLFDIPDIRMFWSTDKRFLSQFSNGKITKFKPYSKFEACYKDLSFYLSDKFNYNNFCTIVREIDKSNNIESIKLIDDFEHAGKKSHCYRITYRSMDTTLKNSEVDKIQNLIRQKVQQELDVKVR